MEHIIVADGLKSKKLGKKYKYSVNVFGQRQFSMPFNSSIKQGLDEANRIYHEDEYFAVLKNLYVKVLKYNNFYFDGINIMRVGG